MKDRPILFSAPMVRALLDGRKSQTRRFVKLPRKHSWGTGYDGQIIFDDGSAFGGELSVDELSCPYGQPGSRLWVKETHAFIWEGEHAPESKRDCLIEYRAETNGKCFAGDWPEEERDNEDRPKWKPSIFMPRWASRILLEITAIRVERLQDISEADAIAEGATFTDFGKNRFGQQHNGWRCDRVPVNAGDALGSARFAYGNLWESINGACSWDANPWVWVIEFKRIES